MEKSVPTNGEKQAIGIFADERRRLDLNSEPVVEVFDGPSVSSSTSGDKLKTISHRIRNAELGKILLRGGSEVDGTKDHSKEGPAIQASGMLVDGQSAQSEDDLVCQARDEWHDPNQGISGRIGDNQAFGDSIPGEMGVEEGVVGRMEVERH